MHLDRYMFSLRPTNRYIQFLPADCNHNRTDPQRECPSQVRRPRKQQYTLLMAWRPVKYGSHSLILKLSFNVVCCCFFLLDTCNFSIDKKITDKFDLITYIFLSVWRYTAYPCIVLGCLWKYEFTGRGVFRVIKMWKKLSYFILQDTTAILKAWFAIKIF